MSAVMERQASLDGVAPCDPLPDAHLQVAVIGTLMQHAVLRRGTDGSEQITVVVEQRVRAHPLAKPVVGVRVYAADAAPNATHQVAHAATARLRAGTEVLLRGRGIEQAHHEGQPVLRLLHVDAVLPLDDLNAHNGGY